MARAESISIDEVMKHAKLAAEKVLGDRQDLFGPQDLGVFRDWGTVGIWIKDPIWERIEPQKMFEISAQMTEAMGPVARGGVPMAKIVGKGVTLGYFTPDPEFMTNFK